VRCCLLLELAFEVELESNYEPVIYIWYFHLNHLQYKYSIYQTSHINCIIEILNLNAVLEYSLQLYLTYSITWKHLQDENLANLMCSMPLSVAWWSGIRWQAAPCFGQDCRDNMSNTMVIRPLLNISLQIWIVFHGMVNLEMPSWYYQGNLSTTLKISGQNRQHFVPHQNRMTTLSDWIHQVH
jgi:hypothetical protein